MNRNLFFIFFLTLVPLFAYGLTCSYRDDEGLGSANSANITCAPLFQNGGIVMDLAGVPTSPPVRAPSAAIEYVSIDASLYATPFIASSATQAGRSNTKAVITTVKMNVVLDRLTALKNAATEFELAAKYKSDLILFPELYFVACHPSQPITAECLGWQADVANQCSLLSVRYAMWSVCTTVTVENQTRDGNEVSMFFNSAMVFNRTGYLVGTYHKLFPVMEPQFGIDNEAGYTPGLQGVMAFDTDFGVRFSILICNDIMLSEVFSQMAALSVDLVLWPAAWKGGKHVYSFAFIHSVYIVNAPGTSQQSTSEIPLVADPSGRVIDGSSPESLYVDDNTFVISIETECSVVHSNFNHRMNQMISDSKGDIVIQSNDPITQIYVLIPSPSAQRPVFLRETLRQYGVYTQRALDQWMREQLNAIRMVKGSVPASPQKSKTRRGGFPAFP